MIPLIKDSKNSNSTDGGNQGKQPLNIKGDAPITPKQSNSTFRHVTEQYSKNPQNSPAPKQNSTALNSNSSRTETRPNSGNTQTQANSQHNTAPNQTAAPQTASQPPISNNQPPTAQTVQTATAQAVTSAAVDSDAFSPHISPDPANPLPVLVLQTIFSVLQQYDVYLDAENLEAITKNIDENDPSSSAVQNLIPKIVEDFVSSVRAGLSGALVDSHLSDRQIVRQTADGFAGDAPENLLAVKQVLLENPLFGAKIFAHLSVREKLDAAVQLMLDYLPETDLPVLQNYSAKEIVNGMLLARGIIVPQATVSEINGLLTALKSVEPNEISMTNLRDLGQLIKVLIADTGAARTVQNLDLAVQKFVRILIANNEFEVLLAAVGIANQTGISAFSRSQALVEIYSLISRLLEAGENVLKQTENAAKNIVRKNELENFLSVAVREKDVKTTDARKNGIAGAESSLRQFLEFNPGFARDRAISAFVNPDDARDARRDFTNHFQHEIDAWLRSGNHRLVKDYNLDKPIGIVVERGRDSLFNATQMRLVLVRDGSLEGWHFLKSFLVR